MRNFKGAFIKFILFLPLIILIGCGGNSGSSDSGENRQDNLGESVNKTIKNYIASTDDADKKLAAYSNHEGEIVVATNHVVEYESENDKKNRSRGTLDPKLLQGLFYLIKDNTVPQLTDALGQLLRSIGEDKVALQAITTLLNNHNGANLQNISDLFYRLLNYTDNKALWNACADLLQKNPQLLIEIFRLAHNAVMNIPEDGSLKDYIALLSKEVVQLHMNLGRDVWIVKLDKNNNPKVLKDGDTLFLPFVDEDEDGFCDVNENGQPIDSDGKVINIPGFSNLIYKDANGNIIVKRDEFNRAISPDGKLIFQYYNAKKTVLALGINSIATGLEYNLPHDILKVVNIILSNQNTNVSNEQRDSLINILDILKQEQFRYLLLGFAVMINEQDPKMVAQAFMGLGQLIFKELRDNPDIKDKESLEKWFQEFPDNPPPSIFPMLQLMSQTQIEGLPYPNMVMLFFYWISSNYPELSTKIWPAIQILRTIEAKEPKLTEKIYNNVIMWTKWALIHRLEIESFRNRSGKAIASIVIKKFVEELSKDPEQIVEKTKIKITSFLQSRYFALLMKCLNNFVGYDIFRHFIIYCTTPQEDPDCDIYSELVCVVSGVLSSSNNVCTNIHLFKVIGTFLDPELPIVMNLIDSIARLTINDNKLVFLKITRNVFSRCPRYGIAPIGIFNIAYVDVLRSCNPDMYKRELKESDVYMVCKNLTEFLLEPYGILKRFYKIVQKHAK